MVSASIFVTTDLQLVVETGKKITSQEDLEMQTPECFSEYILYMFLQLFWLSHQE
jgi:hypothetical protein